jgi:hypothetical protein
VEAGSVGRRRGGAPWDQHRRDLAFEGLILGIVAYLRAVLVAAIAVVTTMGIATYVGRQRSKGDSRGAQQSLS